MIAFGVLLAGALPVGVLVAKVDEAFGFGWSMLLALIYALGGAAAVVGLA